MRLGITRAEAKEGARQLVEMWRGAPDLLAGLPDRVDRWVMAEHDVERVDGEVFCLGHWGKPVPWPCKEWTEAAERRQARRHEKTKGADRG